MRSNAQVNECADCGMLCPNPGHWDELDKCLCCGKELCKWCLMKHGRIATEKKKQRPRIESVLHDDTAADWRAFRQEYLERDEDD